MRHWLFVGALVAAGVGLAACGRPAAPPGGRTPSSPVIDIVAKEWEFEPSTITVSAGRQTFRLTNDGVVEHNVVIEGLPGSGVSHVSPGEAKVFEVTLAPGSYTAFCDLPGHREAGMVASVKVSQ